MAAVVLTYLAFHVARTLIARQVISNLLDWHMDPQLALDMPRFCLDQLSNAAGPACVAAGSTVKLEEGLPAAASSGLQVSTD